MSNRIRFYWLCIRSQVDVFGGPANGSEYSMDNACPKCGTGAVLSGPLILANISRVKKELFSTLDSDVVLSDRLVALLKTDGISSFGTILQKRGRTPLPFKVLLPQAELPPFLPSSPGVVRENPCPVCNRDGYFGIPHQPMIFTYDMSVQAFAGYDVLATWERFGLSVLRTPFHESTLAAHDYVVSQKFVDCLTRNKVKRFDAKEVIFTADIP